jgi:hypothetical protein
LAADVHRVLLGPKGFVILSIGCLIHALTILVVWSIGRAQGLALPLPNAAVLFTVMIAVVLVPISIGGWGLRELAVISVFATYGVAPERALLFSVCFGLAPRGRVAAWSAGLAFVSIRARSAFCRARWVKGARHVASGHAVGRRAGYR